MIPDDILFQLVSIATEPWDSWYHVAPPTPGSVERIQRELSITIPEDYVSVAAACASYGSWLAGLGDDYENNCHILALNTVFHTADETPALSNHFILLNHGHDGDCDCWDTRELTSKGEHPIVYINLESGNLHATGKQFTSFRSYIEQFALDHAPANREKRRRARKLIREYSSGLQD